MGWVLWVWVLRAHQPAGSPHHIICFCAGASLGPAPLRLPRLASPRLASPLRFTASLLHTRRHSHPPRLKYSLAFAFPPPRPRSHHLASRLQWGASCPSRRGRVSSRPTTPPRSPPTTPQIPVSPTAAIAALLNPNPPSPHHHRSCFLI